MNVGNKVEVADIGAYEITIARCGLVELIWIASPFGYSKYEIRSKKETIYETMFLTHAIEKYNKIIS